jgi:hypothetical protein
MMMTNIAHLNLNDFFKIELRRCQAINMAES